MSVEGGSRSTDDGRGGTDQPEDAALVAVSRRWSLPATVVPSLRQLLDLLASPAAPTAVHDRARALDVHVRDSLAGLEVGAVRRARRIADLGSGAGLPGLPLALALPDSQMQLVESHHRRCAFLDRAVEDLGLSNVTVACARAEELADREHFDVVTARALAALPVLCEYAAPLLRVGGALVAWKGAVEAGEAAAAAAAARSLGLDRAEILPVVPYPGSERRTLHVFRKLAPTPPGYPRRPGMAAKRPLGARRSR